MHYIYLTFWESINIIGRIDSFLRKLIEAYPLELFTLATKVNSEDSEWYERISFLY